MRVGVADHLGWAVLVTATDDRAVVDRRRIELVEPGVAWAPIHHEGKPLDDDGAAELVATVRASIARTAAVALDELAAVLPAPVVSFSLRVWPTDFPQDIAVQRRVPYEARADAVMYRQALADLAGERAWAVHLYDAKKVIGEAAAKIGQPIEAFLQAPREILGPPWTTDHRTAFAATIAAG